MTAPRRIAGMLGPRLSRALIALFVASFVVRAVFLVAVTGLDRPLEGDEPSYHDVAASFLRGDGWEDSVGRKSHRPPVLPLQLMLVYAVTGPSPQAGMWTMVLFSSLVAPALYLVARTLLRGREDVALLASVAWVLYPPAVYYSGLILSENGASLLVVAGLGSFLWAARGGRRAVALTGLLWALAALNRPAYLFLPLFVLLAQLALYRTGPIEWRWPASGWLLGLAVFVAVIAPWTLRNYLEHRVFMPIHSGTGEVLLITNGDLANPEIQAGSLHYRSLDLDRLLAGAKTEAERDSLMLRLALEEIKSNWRLLPTPLLNRAKNFWTPRPDPYDPSWTRNDLIMMAIWVPVLVFFLTSSFTRSWGRSWPALAVVLHAFVLTLPFWGSPRFRFPVDPLIIALAAHGFVEAAVYAYSLVRGRLKPAAGRPASEPVE